MNEVQARTSRAENVHFTEKVWSVMDRGSRVLRLGWLGV